MSNWELPPSAEYRAWKLPMVGIYLVLAGPVALSVVGPVAGKFSRMMRWL